MVALALSAIGLAGCGASAVKTSDAVPGVLTVWGNSGRVDGDFVKPRVIDVVRDNLLCVIDRSGRAQLLDFQGRFAGKFLFSDAQRGYPTGMTVTSDGNLLIAETHNYRVAEYSPEGREIRAFGSMGTGDGQFVYVSNVAISPAGRIYVSDFGTVDRIQEFDKDGRFVRRLAETGTAPGKLQQPRGLAVAPDGSLFVTDACNDRVQRFSSDGTFLAVYGGPGSGEGQFRYPYGIAISKDGIVYVAEYGNCRVQRMTVDGAFMGTWGSRGREVGQLAEPWGVALDGKGKLFVLDTGNSRVVVLDLASMKWSTQIRKG